MINMGQATKMIMDFMVSVTGDVGFHNEEVLMMIQNTQGKKRRPKASVYNALNEALTERGYKYACNLIDANLSGDFLRIQQAFSGQ